MRFSREFARRAAAGTDSEAVHWLLLARDGCMTDAERKAFDIWHAQEKNAAAYKKAVAIWDAVGDVANDPAIALVRGRIGTIKRQRLSHLIAGAAAGVILALISAVALRSIETPTKSRIHKSAPISNTLVEGLYRTAVGERSTVTLPDGSVLTLNTNSAANIAFDRQERKVILVRGQALFEVAKKQPRPFVVYASDQRIVATGTAFDVRLEAKSVQVTLVEGHVVVHPTGDLDGKSRRNVAELSAGEKLVATQGAPLSISSANVERITSWTAGKLVFLDARLTDAIAESNRYTRAPIIIDDKSIADLRVSGVFRAGQPEEFARALAEVYPVSFVVLGDGTIHLSLR